MRSGLMLVALGLSGCVAIVDVSGYTIDHNPCGPHPTCVGGRELVFAISDGDVARKSPEGLVDGVDLDGTDRAVCGHADFVAPRGETGIDNQLADLAVAFETTSGTSLHTQVQAGILDASALQIYTIQHVDDPMNDDCVFVESRHAFLHDPTTPTDADHDRQLDPNLTLDYNTPSERDNDACIVDGVLYARFPDGPVSFLGTGGAAEFTGHRRRLRAPIDESGIHRGILAGSVEWVELAAAVLPDVPALASFLASTADLDPSSIGARDCQSISYAVTFETVPASLGDQRL